MGIKDRDYWHAPAGDWRPEDGEAAPPTRAWTARRILMWAGLALLAGSIVALAVLRNIG